MNKKLVYGEAVRFCFRSLFFITVCRDPIRIINIDIEIYSFTYDSFLVCRRGSGFVFFEVVPHMTYRYSIHRGKRAGFLTVLSTVVSTYTAVMTHFSLVRQRIASLPARVHDRLHFSTGENSHSKCFHIIPLMSHVCLIAPVVWVYDQ